MELFLATGNLHKKKEFQDVLPEFKILIPSDLNLEFDPDECGSSFFENSMIKALALYEITGKPVIADDSGLVVDALNGEPGIYSARYGNRESGRILDTPERNAYLLSKVSKTDPRNARFICNIVFLINKFRFYSIQEDFCGVITDKPSGNHGFGYDPVFFLPEIGKTAAEIDDDHKNRISHRGKALNRISGLINNFYLK